MYDAIILKDLTNEKKKNSADFENSYLAKNRFYGFESPWHDPCLGRDPYFKNHCFNHLVTQTAPIICAIIGR